MLVNQTWEDILIIYYDHIVFIPNMQSWLNTHTHTCTYTHTPHVHTENTIGKAIYKQTYREKSHYIFNAKHSFS